MYIHINIVPLLSKQQFSTITKNITAMKTTWKIDPTHSEVQFKVKHLVISTITGNFGKFEATAEAQEDDFESAKVRFTADVDSINTSNAQRDTHLKSAEFFDAANHVHVTFVSKEIKKITGSTYKMTGDLTIRGVTKPVELNVEFGGIAKDPWGMTRAGFEVTGKINRKDFGLNWNAVTEAGGLVVSDEVKIVCQVEFVKEAVPAPAETANA